MPQTNPIAAKLLRSQRYIVVGIISMFAILMVITAAAGRGYVDRETVSSTLSNTYSNIWGNPNDVVTPEEPEKQS